MINLPVRMLAKAYFLANLQLVKFMFSFFETNSLVQNKKRRLDLIQPP